ncbi:MAG: ABC transporter ATP-binding protein, partial [Janthinobacterium lividum]
QATIAGRFDDIVAFSEIERFIDTEVKFYSSGMFLRLAFAVAVHTDPEVFLIDEILSVGDEPFQQKCLARIEELRAQGKTLVIVSHDLDMVARLCDRGVLLEQGHVVADEGVVRVVARMRGQDPDEAERRFVEDQRRREERALLDGTVDEGPSHD